MKKRKEPYSFLVLVMILLLMSACSAPVIGTGGSALTAIEVLQNSSAAMKQLKSVHFDLSAASIVHTSNLPTTASATPTTASATPTTTSAMPTTTAPVPGQVSLSITGHGDESLPGQQSLQIAVTQSGTGQSISLSEILLGSKVYVQNPKGQWFVLDKSVLEGFIANPFAGINVDPLAFLGLLQDATIIDHGTELLNGQDLRHISATLDKAALKLLLNNNTLLNKLFGQQNITNVLDRARGFQSSLDLWIDETNFYVHRTELKFSLGEDLSSLGASVTPTATASVGVLPGLTVNFDSIVDLSNFNQPVTITLPANAIPTDNPFNIFGTSG
jgi:hypothetical protein